MISGFHRENNRICSWMSVAREILVSLLDLIEPHSPPLSANDEVNPLAPGSVTIRANLCQGLAPQDNNLLTWRPSRYAAEFGSCSTVTGIPVDPEVVLVMQAFTSVLLDVLNSSEVFLISSLVMMGNLLKLETSVISRGPTLFFVYNLLQNGT